jgi:hypothetical protein
MKYRLRLTGRPQTEGAARDVRIAAANMAKVQARRSICIRIRAAE